MEGVVLKTESAWKCYFENDVYAAFNEFKQCLEVVDWYGSSPNIALGISKVYTRIGHLELAKRWGLYFLFLAREQDARKKMSNVDLALTKGYGALAEVFLRAKENDAALACFKMAHVLAPLDRRDIGREYNYIGSALMRKQEWLRAEAVIRSSLQVSLQRYQMGVSTVDQSSVLHSYARLNFLYLFKTPCSTDIAKFYDEPHHENAQIAANMPLAYLMIGYAIREMRLGNQAESIRYLCRAQQYVPKAFVLEQLWLARLLASLSVVMPLPTMSIDAVYPPDFQVVVDKNFAAIELVEDNFKAISEAEEDFETLISLWYKFFI